MPNKVGRPSEYKSSYIDKVDQYLLTTGREQTELPTIEGFAKYLDVDSDSINNWAKKHDDFSVRIKRIFEYQKNQLMNDGLYGGKDVNAAMAIFLLKVNHGLTEQSKLDLTSQGQKIEPTQIIIVEDKQEE